MPIDPLEARRRMGQGAPVAPAPPQAPAPASPPPAPPQSPPPGFQMAGGMAQDPQAAVQNYLMQKYQSLAPDPEFEKNLSKAQEDAANQRFLARMGEAGATVGNAFMPQGYQRDDYSFWRGLGGDSEGRVADMTDAERRKASQRLDIAMSLAQKYGDAQKVNQLQSAKMALEDKKHENKMAQMIKEAELKEKEPKEAEELKLTKGEEALDREVAKNMARWVHQGQKASVMSDIDKLKEVEKQLADGSNYTGPLMGRLPGQTFINPTGVAIEEAVASVTQKNLRDTLGGQFAQKEGEQLIRRAYNPTLSEEENLKRIKRLREAMEKAVVAKDDAATYFAEKGTMKGYQPRTMTAGKSSETPKGAPGTAYAGEKTITYKGKVFPVGKPIVNKKTGQTYMFDENGNPQLVSP